MKRTGVASSYPRIFLTQCYSRGSNSCSLLSVSVSLTTRFKSLRKSRLKRRLKSPRSARKSTRTRKLGMIANVNIMSARC